MDVSLVFRLILIVVAAFALVMIISQYCSAVAPADGPGPEAAETFSSPQGAGASPGLAQATPADVAANRAAASSGQYQPRAAQPQRAPAASASASAYASGPGHVDATRPEDLMPMLGNSPHEQKFLEANPIVPGDVRSQNHLHVDAIGGAVTNVMKVANRQLRSDPLLVPKKVSPWMNTPYEMNAPNRGLELGSISSV